MLLCWPAFTPQILGELKPEDPDATKLSVHPSVAVVSAASDVVVGPTVVNVSKSIRIVQISELHLLIV